MDESDGVTPTLTPVMLTDDHQAIAYSFGLALLRERRKHGTTVNASVLFKQYKKLLTTMARSERLSGAFKVGCYRIAFVTENVVYKFQYNEHESSSILDEFNFIAGMRETAYQKHFPVSALIRSVTFPVLIQERIDMSHKGIPETLHMQARLLGRRLGLEDVHIGNYGWKGARREEYPVYIDVDFRSTHGCKLRSWFV